MLMVFVVYNFVNYVLEPYIPRDTPLYMFPATSIDGIGYNKLHVFSKEFILYTEVN